MNKNLILIATALALGLTCVGCNKSGKLSQPSKFTPPNGPVELKLKWPQGERVVQDMVMTQNMEISISGRAAPIRQDITMGQEYGLTVLKENPDGGHELEMEFLSARVGLTRGGKTILDYDSAEKSSAEKSKMVADVFGKIIGSKIQYFLDASNDVDRVEGVDELGNRLESGGQAHGKPGERQIAQSLKSMYNESYFKQLMGANRYMPPKAVQPGDTWPVQTEIPMSSIGAIVSDLNLTFQNWEMHGERNCARIEFEGTIKNKTGPNTIPAGMSVSILDGNVSGVSWFDPELGITIDATVNQDMKMVITMPMNPRGNTGAAGRMQTITNQMNQVITIKLASVK